jgi:diadenosine tetraphosphate (Ap4A) HIT family hydrolase
MRDAVIGECAAVSAFIKRELGYDKVNVAGLGNVVADMHLHVIGRRVGDACWPQPVWGNLPPGDGYTQRTLEEWQAGLVERIGLEAVPVKA